MKFTKSYAIFDETEFEVTVTNDGCNRTLSICTYWKGEKIPLYTQTTSDLTVSFVTRIILCHSFNLLLEWVNPPLLSRLLKSTTLN